MNRWAEYKSGTLTPPAVVQHDQVGSEHLIWVWTGAAIIGPLSRRSFDEPQAVADALASVSMQSEKPVTVEDELRAKLEEKEAVIVSLQVEKAELAVMLDAKVAEIDDLKARVEPVEVGEIDLGGKVEKK